MWRADLCKGFAFHKAADAHRVQLFRDLRGGQLHRHLTVPLCRNSLVQRARSLGLGQPGKVCVLQKGVQRGAHLGGGQAIRAAQGHEALPAAADAQVLVQGIADLVLVYPDHLELLDYKTDRRKAESDFLRAYRAQLNLYAIAIEKRFSPKKVTYKGIYSFALGKLIEA